MDDPIGGNADGFFRRGDNWRLWTAVPQRSRGRDGSGGGPAMASKCSPPRGLSPAAVPGGYCDGGSGAGLVDGAVVRLVVRSDVRSRNRPREKPLEEIGRECLAVSRHVVDGVRQLAEHVDAQDRREISEFLEQCLLRLRAWPGAFAGAAVPGGTRPQVFDPLRFRHQVLAGGCARRAWWTWWAWWIWRVWCDLLACAGVRLPARPARCPSSSGRVSRGLGRLWPVGRSRERATGPPGGGSARSRAVRSRGSAWSRVVRSGAGGRSGRVRLGCGQGRAAGRTWGGW